MDFDARYLVAMEKAWWLVDPGRVRLDCDWKDPVDATVTAEGLGVLGYRDVRAAIKNIEEAVAFYTATEAKVVPCGPGMWRVTADGYRAGPAGDH